MTILIQNHPNDFLFYAAFIVTKQQRVTRVCEGGLARVEFVVNIQDGLSVENVGRRFLHRRPFL